MSTAHAGHFELQLLHRAPQWIPTGSYIPPPPISTAETTEKRVRPSFL
jgi:hypothetical protein